MSASPPEVGASSTEFCSSMKLRRALGPSVRSASVKIFKVMEVLARARELEAHGKSIMHLEVGQPKTGAPSKVIETSRKFLDESILGYTTASGILPLRKRIAQHYMDKYGVEVPEKRVVVTTGSSGAFPLVFITAFDVGDRVAVASSSYPCYRNILNALGCEVVSIPIDSQYKVTAEAVSKLADSLGNAGVEDMETKGGSAATAADAVAKSCSLKGLILSSPSNPTGAMLSAEEIRHIVEVCEEKGIVFISDEIYHGICYGEKTCQTALAYTDQCYVINSFSKYYSMTGWRLGWMVVPENMLEPVGNLSQNLFINAPTLSQLSACSAAFDCDDELGSHLRCYTHNRDILLKGLGKMGFTNVAPSDGAFYVYVDVSEQVEDSTLMASDLLEEAGVAITPGVDFEDPASDIGRQRVRFSFCGATEDIKEAMVRMETWWAGYPKKKNP